jgi:hypothetical protein
MRLLKLALLPTIGIVLPAVILLSCGGESKPGTVNVSMSDPSTCAAPQGPYRHIYVTVTDVEINKSANASDNDSSWVHLTPGLKDKPIQVDLLGVSQQCFLAMLGSAGIQPGTYEQIRVVLAPNTESVANNKCGTVANCLMLTSDPGNTPQTLLLSSESQTGIKIPSGQIAGGSFTIGSGETKDLNIDFDACASIVTQGNVQYRLKPVLHAGEVQTQSSATSISGTVIDGNTLQPVAGGNTIVALEQVDGTNVDRVIMQGVANSAGNFVFCPVPAGTYDLVAIAVDVSGNTYSATVIRGVGPGKSLGTIPLTPAGAPGSISGDITTSNSNVGTAADLTVSALQPIGNNVMVTVPLAQQSEATATVASVDCGGNADCASYQLFLPAGNPSIGNFNPVGNQQPGAPAGSPFNYTVDVQAFVPGSAGQSDCNPPDLQTNMTDSNTTLSVTAGSPVNAATLGFTGCQ